MGEVFTRRLREMDGRPRRTSARPSGPRPTLRSCAARSSSPRSNARRYRTCVNETFSADIPIRFETAPDLVSGIELATNGQRVGWSIADYLASLEESVGELLKEKDEVEARGEPKPRTEPVHPSGAKGEPEPEETKPEVHGQ